MALATYPLWLVLSTLEVLTALGSLDVVSLSLAYRRMTNTATLLLKLGGSLSLMGSVSKSSMMASAGHSSGGSIGQTFANTIV